MWSTAFNPGLSPRERLWHLIYPTFSVNWVEKELIGHLIQNPIIVLVGNLSFFYSEQLLDDNGDFEPFFACFFTSYQWTLPRFYHSNVNYASIILNCSATCDRITSWMSVMLVPDTKRSRQYYRIQILRHPCAVSNDGNKNVLSPKALCEEDKQWFFGGHRITSKQIFCSVTNHAETKCSLIPYSMKGSESEAKGSHSFVGSVAVRFFIFFLKPSCLMNHECCRAT